MIAHWMRVGFVHGVMNTDNMSIFGLTIDYGPYGWIDNFDRDWTANTTDAERRRYRFGQLPQIAYWNLGRLASALAPVFPDHEPLHAGLKEYVDTYVAADREHTAAKLGLADCRDEDLEAMQSLHALLEQGEIDMTLFFRALADLDPAAPRLEIFADAFYDAGKRASETRGLSRTLRQSILFDSWMRRLRTSRFPFVASATFIRTGRRFGVGSFLLTVVASLVMVTPFILYRYGMSLGLEPMHFALAATFAYLGFYVTVGVLVGGCWSAVVRAFSRQDLY